MPLSLPSINAAIVCDGNELETYDVKQEGTSSLSAFIASEAGKQFKITFSNNLSNVEFALFLHIDGRQIQRKPLRARSSGEFLGLYKSAHSKLPYKFQEIQLVDSDSEDAPVAPEMGTIEIKAYRCQIRVIKDFTESRRRETHEGLHLGRVSERSKKAGWHHVATGDEIPVRKRSHRSSHTKRDYVYSRTDPPYASIKVFYRPRELLRAQGIIPANDAGKQGSQINNKKRARENGSPGPSRKRPNIKGEELSEDACTQRLQALQAEMDALKATMQSGTPVKRVKRELRSPSPIVVRNSGEVVDLTLDE